MQNLKLIILFITALILISCNKEVLLPDNKEGVSLSLTISKPEIKLDTKGLEDNSDTDLSTWSDWEKAVDGRIIYSLTACLLDRSTKRVIAFREISKGSDDLDSQNGFLNDQGVVDVNLVSGTKVKLTFSYDNPKHGNDGIEKLRRGEYSLILVANYDPITLNNGSGTSTYNGLENEEMEFHTKLKEKITSNKINFLGVDKSNLTDLFTFKQSAGDDYLCTKQPQPLTLVKVIGLKSGQNNVSCVLERTYSRIRLEVENNSSNYNLSVNNLVYSTNFAQKEAYIFDDPDNLDLKYSITDKGAPSLTSNDAIVKFIPNLIINKYDANSLSNRKVVFDGYIFESKDITSATPYKYTLDVEYKDVTNYIGGYKVDNTPITTVDAFRNSVGSNNKKLFVLKSSYFPDRFIVSGKNKVTTAVTTIEDVCKAVEENNATSYLWEYERKTSGGDVNYFSLKNVGLTSYYFAPTSTVLDSPIILTPELKNYYQMWGVNNNGLQFRVETYNYMIKVVPDDLSTLATTNSMRDNGTGMVFYSVSKLSDTPRFNKEIVFTTIDPITSVANPVTIIKRNDFIKTLVTVNYNILGADIDFTVVPWISVSGDITFN